MDNYHMENLFNEMIEDINVSKLKLIKYYAKNNYQN